MEKKREKKIPFTIVSKPKYLINLTKKYETLYN